MSAARLLLRLALLALPLAAARAETLVCAGVLGNSGEQGRDLARCAAAPARGLGVVCDRFGTLWDRAGSGVLARYAVDGRMLAQYRIPAENDRRDQLALVGDTLVLLINGRLHTLAITALPDSAATPMTIEATCLSPSAWHGTVAIATKQGLATWAVAEEAAPRPVAALAGIEAVEIGADGALYAMVEWQVHKFVAGAEISDGWPRAAPGERPQLLDGWWYGHAWNSTIKRCDADLAPQPGVVLGGASGSFIGHLDQSADLVNGRGLARLDRDLFAVSGFTGTLQLLAWNENARQFAVVRRIAALPRCPALGRDRAGDVWQWNGAWRWDDRPDAPLRDGVTPPEELGQAVMLDDDVMVAPGVMWGKPTLMHGRLDGEVAVERIEEHCTLRRNLVGSATYRDGDHLVLLTIDAAGAGHAFAIDPVGHFRGDLGAVELATATPVVAWTALAMAGADALLATGDGCVLEFARAGGGWHETRRWRSWGAGETEHFGAVIHISSDAHTLAVSDRDRHRVLCFATGGGSPRATFGRCDEAGADLATLSAPTTVAVRGERVVVFDAGNQRLVKLLSAP